MLKTNKLPRRAPRSSSKGAPLIVLAALATGALSSYLVGLMTLQFNHPVHWALAIAGGAVGWLIGKFIYRLRGDRDIF